MSEKYKNIVKHYEQCFEKHGDNHLGVDWPNEKDAQIRYQVMLDLIKFNLNENLNDTNTLLDFGCGTAHLLEYIKSKGMNTITYSGLDLSEKFIEVCKQKFPKDFFICGDVLNDGFSLPTFQYIILNGVFTEKRELSFDEMWVFFTTMISTVFKYASKGIAFNVMSKNVDWERDDLFHVSLDQLTGYLTKNLSRNFIIRNDYRLYEYTVYLYK